MIIDIHSHILPGIDDGAKDMEETKEMLHLAVEEGISGIVATPHYSVEIEEDVLSIYEEAYQEVLRYMETHEIPVKLYRGNEIYYTESVPERLQDGEIYTINNTRYVLIEFSMGVGYSFIEGAVRHLLNSGYWPILAHVERYQCLRKLKNLEELIRIGVCVQVNTNAIIGKDGWQTRRFCHQLLKRRLVHAIGTDTHGSRHRRPKMKECIHYIDKKYGRDYRVLISGDNPRRILKGEKIRGKN